MTRTPRARAAADGFTLAEVLVTLAILTIVLLPALSTFRFLLRSAERLLSAAQAQAAVSLHIASAVVTVRSGETPDPVQSGTTESDGAPSMRWIRHVYPVAGGAGPGTELYQVHCEVSGMGQPRLADGRMRLSMPRREP